MYANDRTNLRILHLLDSPERRSMSQQANEGDSESLASGGMDPFGEQLLSMALELLGKQERITIKELLDAFEEKGIQAGDSVVRERVSELVDRRQLECLPGSGRRPSYYFLPNNDDSTAPTNLQPQIRKIEYATPDDADSLQRLLELESQLQSEAELIQEQLNVKLNNLASVQEDIEAFRRVVKVKIRLGKAERVNDGGQQ